MALCYTCSLSLAFYNRNRMWNDAVYSSNWTNFGQFLLQTTTQVTHISRLVMDVSAQLNLFTFRCQFCPSKRLVLLRLNFTHQCRTPPYEPSSDPHPYALPEWSPLPQILSEFQRWNLYRIAVAGSIWIHSVRSWIFCSLENSSEFRFLKKVSACDDWRLCWVNASVSHCHFKRIAEFNAFC